MIEGDLICFFFGACSDGVDIFLQGGGGWGVLELTPVEHGKFKKKI